MTIKAQSLVSIHYRLSDADSDRPIDSTDGKPPVVYLHGAGQIVTGLEKALTGMQAGDSFDVIVEAAEAYGDYREDRVQTVPVSLFDGVERLVAGAKVTAETERGRVSFLVREVQGDQVTVDGNHPLAGRRLRFQGEVVAASQTRPVDSGET